VADASLSPAFTDAEWQAIKAMCTTAQVTPGPTDPGKTDKNS
jgi:hypothetical protein